MKRKGNNMSDKISFKSQISDYLSELANTISKLDIDQIDEVLNRILTCYQKSGTIYTFGNGGSASTASHMMSDFNKGVSLELEKKMNVVCLSDNIPTITAIANDCSYEDIYFLQIKNKLKKDDLIIAFSGSGNSKNIIKAVKYAASESVDVIGVTGYDGGALYKLSNYHLHANIDNMQISEDIHLIFNHLLMYILKRHLEK